jgi:hypothetical protein
MSDEPDVEWVTMCIDGEERQFRVTRKKGGTQTFQANVTKKEWPPREPDPFTQPQGGPPPRAVRVVNLDDDADNDAHQSRLRQAHDLLVELGYTLHDDGSWHPPTEPDK